MSGSQILVVDDESDIRSLIQEILAEEGYDVTTAADAEEARASWAALHPDLVLLDIWMPDTDGITLLREWSRDEAVDCPVVMMSGHGTVETAVEATRLGAVDFIEKPLSLAKLLRTVERALSEARNGKLGARTLVPAMLAPVGKSQIMQGLREQAQRIAPHGTPVLITGEPGTGREAFAHYIHNLSARADQPFEVLVAASIGDDDAASPLMGNEGAFARVGGGTLFINELGDLSPVAQKLLAGVLEQGGYTPSGGGDHVALEARLISSAQPVFEHDMEEFRRDLVSHLNVLPLRIPPLRTYAEDVPDLLRYYVDKLVDTEVLGFRRFGVAAQNRLRNYPWPGNIRELRNLIHRLLILGGDEEIGLKEIERELNAEVAGNEPLVKQDLLAMPLREAREQFERAYLQQQLILCNGKVGQLAKRVGMERTHLYRKLRSLGVDFRQTVSDD